MRIHPRPFTIHRISTLTAALALVASLTAAQDEPVRARTDARGPSGATTALSLFVGPPSGETFQILTGYDEGTVYTNTRGGAEVTPDAIVLRSNGVYRIHLEGILFAGSSDPAADPAAAGLYSIVLGGEEAVSCSTQPLGIASKLPAVIQPTPDHDSIASCTVDFTLEVRSESTGGGFAFPRGTTLQAAITPNDLPLGASLALVRFEVTRVGN